MVPHIEMSENAFHVAYAAIATVVITRNIPKRTGEIQLSNETMVNLATEKTKIVLLTKCQIPANVEDQGGLSLIHI